MRLSQNSIYHLRFFEETCAFFPLTVLCSRCFITVCSLFSQGPALQGRKLMTNYFKRNQFSLLTPKYIPLIFRPTRRSQPQTILTVKPLLSDSLTILTHVKKRMGREQVGLKEFDIVLQELSWTNSSSLPKGLDLAMFSLLLAVTLVQCEGLSNPFTATSSNTTKNSSCFGQREFFNVLLNYSALQKENNTSYLWARIKRKERDVLLLAALMSLATSRSSA